MKKLFVLALAVCLCLSFSGCGLGLLALSGAFDTYDSADSYQPQVDVTLNSDVPNIREEFESNMAAFDEMMEAHENGEHQHAESDDGHVHQFSPPTCMNRGKCACGLENINDTIPGHDYSEPTCTSPKICSRCGKETGKPVDHQYSNGICIYCSAPQNTGNANQNTNQNTNQTQTQQGSHSHHYTAASCTGPQTCSCGATAPAPGHDYAAGLCSRCGHSIRVYLIEDIDYLSTDGVFYDTDRMQDNYGNDISGHYHFYDLDLLSGPQTIDFHIGGQYSTFCGMIFLPYEDRGSDNTSSVTIYGDGKLLYQSQDIEKLFQTENFSIDVSNISVLTIEFDGLSYSLGYVTNAFLY